MPEAIDSCAIAIIGGGPAGCAAAIMLARAGRAVVLLEKEAGPHEKVCGGFLSWEAAHYLTALGIDLPALGAERIGHVRLIDGKKTIESPLPFAAWSLSRTRLDEALLQNAVQAGVDVRRNMTATALSSSGECWDVTLKNHGVLRTRTLMLASGKHDIRGWSRTNKSLFRPAQDMIGFKMHFRLAPAQIDRVRGHTEVFLFDGGYAGLELVERGTANLCFAVRKTLYASCGGTWPDVLAWLATVALPLRDMLDGAEPLWPRPLTIYGVPYGYLYKQDIAPRGLYRLGDQMAVIPSFAGDGISIALHSGVLAAQALLDGTGCGAYHARARRDFRGPVGAASLLARLMSFQPGRSMAFQAASLSPKLIAATIRKIRLRPAMLEKNLSENMLELVKLRRTLSEHSTSESA
jgi:flavin-dependent dehydrogenase